MTEGRGRRRWGRRLLVLYLCLLAASHVARRLERAPPGGDPPPALLRTVEGGVRREPRVPVAWRALGTAGPTSPPPVLLLHGSPGRMADLADLAEGLAAQAPERPVLLLDLPGFGRSARRVPDYSIRAHADYAVQLLDHLGVPRAHVAGFSMGGGVALELARLAPDRVASLALLSAIGVQELELLGSYALNHALHGLQLAFFWLLEEGVPHFGWMDDALLGVPYARNFYDSDQRPLREVLRSWDGPLLLLHGRQDPLVPLAVAHEHARLAPQAVLDVREGGHFLVFQAGRGIGGRLAAFLRDADEGRAPGRSGVEETRVAQSRAPFDPRSQPPLAGLTLLVVLLLAAVATLVSEDLTCVAMGALVGQGRLPFGPTVIACFGGIVAGDLLLFLAGRTLGRRAMARAPFKWWLSEARVERSSRWLEARGVAAAFLIRFLPGLRLPTYFAAGLLRTSALRFGLLFALAAALWTPTLVAVGSVVGERLADRIETVPLAVLGTILLVVVVMKGVLPLLRWRGRRLWVGWWRRKRRWEFWPPWAFYPPVVLTVLLRLVRHLGRPWFTAANPAIPHGGFVGESKWAILQGLAGSPGAIPATAPIAAALPPAARLERARTFLAEHGGLPVVLKPDRGERGRGVSVIRTEEELARYLEGAADDVLVQAYVPGVELGLFYVREPDAERGRLISITEKRLPVLTGDGARTIEELILGDDRAVCMARFYLARNLDRLDTVPAAGEPVVLSELGNHCRGAIFLDGERWRTPALEAAVDRIARAFEGFQFGRLDVRGASGEAIAAGDFLVIEANGVTSEAAHVYDPRHSLLYAWRTLIRQWGLAFAIGRANARRGARVTGLLALLGLILRGGRDRAP